MGLFTWLVVGLIAGWLAGKVMKGRGFGMIGDIVVGIVGALLGGWLAGALFNIQNAISGFNFQTILVALIGSIVLIWLLRLIKK